MLSILARDTRRGTSLQSSWLCLVKIVFQTERYDYGQNRNSISAEELVAINRRPNHLITSLLRADEGASMVECFYTLYYLLHGAVNMKVDIVFLLKKHKITFACVASAEQFDQIEKIFNTNSDGLIPIRPKNYRRDSNCSEETKGVDLKYNFGADNITNACSIDYRGPSTASEPETQALMRYINNTESMVSTVIVLGK